MSVTVFLDTNRTINSFPLKATLQYRLTDNDIKGHLQVYPPKNYVSKLVEAVKLEEYPHFANIDFTITPIGFQIDYFKVIINDARFRPIASKEEMFALKGIGKILLCKLLTFFLNEHKIVLTTFVMLDAMPFLSCNFVTDPILLQTYDKNFTTQSALDFLSQYKNIYKDYILSTNHLNADTDRHQKRKILLNRVCYVHHIIALVEYYKKLGFITNPKDLSEKDYDESVSMFSKVRNVLETCE
jgi:hypothetical protein